MAQIAKAAGVAPATVYATYESKAGIVIGMLDDLEEGIDVGPRLGEAFAATDARRQLRMYVSAHCDLFAAGADILRASMQAIEAPGVAALMERGDGRRRGVIEAFVKGWHQQDALRAGLSPKAAAERLWLLTTVEGFLNAVDRSGWSATEYEAWIGDLAEAEILGPAAQSDSGLLLPSAGLQMGVAVSMSPHERDSILSWSREAGRAAGGAEQRG